MLSSVLTTCAVFVPLIFINGMAGALFYDQAMAVAITLFVAYGVAITLLPVYYRWWYNRQETFRPTPWLQRFSFDRIVGYYETGLKWFFRRRWLMWAIYAVSIVGLAALFWDIDKERLPQMTYSDMLVRIDWNDRISAEENGRRTQALVASLGDRILQSTTMAGIQQFILFAHRGERCGRGHRLPEMPRCRRCETRAAVGERLPCGPCARSPLFVRGVG